MYTVMLLFVAGLLFISCPVQKEGSVHANTSVNDFDAPASEDDFDDSPIAVDLQNDSGGVDENTLMLRQEDRNATLVSLGVEPLAPFFDQIVQMKRTNKGLVRILHYGDSHTAADFLTTAIRRRLQKRFGDGGRGFVLFGNPWRTYGPKDVIVRSAGPWKSERILIAADASKLDGIYGLGGISAKTGKAGASSTVKTTKATGFGRKVSAFEIFYLAQPGGGKFKLYLDGKLKEIVSTAAKIMHSEFYRLEVPEKGHELELRVVGDGEVRVFGGVLENDGPGIVYDTLGINGGFFYTPLRWDADILAQQVERRNPGLIVTMYGTNEADSRSINEITYKQKVIKAMERLRAGSRDAACLMLGPPDRKMHRHPEEKPSQLDWIINVQEEVADEIGCDFINVREIMGGDGSHEKWSDMSPPLAQRDGIHLTVAGYRELGERIVKKIITAYEIYEGAELTGEKNGF